MSRKIKVAWICFFSDGFIQNRLPLWKKTNSVAIWISNTLEGFKNSDEFEIHVISSHPFLRKQYSFIESGISYHFYPSGVPIIHCGWPYFRPDVLSNFYCNRKKIKKIIDQLKPDIVNIHGAENGQYSSSFDDLFCHYPILVTIQGFIRLSSNGNSNYINRKLIEVETQIITRCKYFCLDPDSVSIIKQTQKSNFDFFTFYYPVNSGLLRHDNEKDRVFDLLYWGRICQDKGAEDFIHIVAKLKDFFPDIKACFIGKGSNQYLKHLVTIINSLGCNENITFVGFLNLIEDVYEAASKCKILVIPTYNDRFPTVLREATLLRIAIVAYKTGSIPYYNEKDENILLAEIGDLDQMVNNAKKLLMDNSFYNELINKSYLNGLNEFGVRQNCDKIAVAYRRIFELECKRKLNNV